MCIQRVDNTILSTNAFIHIAYLLLSIRFIIKIAYFDLIAAGKAVILRHCNRPDSMRNEVIQHASHAFSSISR